MSPAPVWWPWVGLIRSLSTARRCDSSQPCHTGLRLTTIGRRTAKERSVILGYFEDGSNLVTMAMNGWSDGELAWWLNLQAHPEARVDVAGGGYPARGRAAQGEERSALWARWQEINKDLDTYAALRSTETAVVVLEPRDELG